MLPGIPGIPGLIRAGSCFSSTQDLLTVAVVPHNEFLPQDVTGYRPVHMSQVVWKGQETRTSREGYAAMHALWPENSASPCSHCSLLLLNRCFVVLSTREEASKSISPLPSCPNSGSYSVCANQREKRFSEFRSWMVLALLDKKSAWPKRISAAFDKSGLVRLLPEEAQALWPGLHIHTPHGSTNFTSLRSPFPNFRRTFRHTIHDRFRDQTWFRF